MALSSFICVYDYGRVGKDGKKRAQHNKKAFAVETIKSEKIKLGCFYVVQDEVRVNGNVRPYDYLDMLEESVYFCFMGKILLP